MLNGLASRAATGRKPSSAAAHRARTDEPLELRHEERAVPGGDDCRGRITGCGASGMTTSAQRRQPVVGDGWLCLCACTHAHNRTPRTTAQCSAAQRSARTRPPGAARRPASGRLTGAHAAAKEALPRLLGGQLDEGCAPEEKACRVMSQESWRRAGARGTLMRRKARVRGAGAPVAVQSAGALPSR